MRLINKSSEQGTLEGRYANYFEVGHNIYEFLFKFGQLDPDLGCAQMHTRIVMGPVHAKLLADMLADAIARFERDHGEIMLAKAQETAGPSVGGPDQSVPKN